MKPNQAATPSPKVTAPKVVVPVRLRGARTDDGGGAVSLGALLIIGGLGLAIACFAIGAVPARAIRWRPAATFVSERQLDATVVGFALFVAAALTFFWTNGP
jgi:hypothetical protein